MSEMRTRMPGFFAEIPVRWEWNDIGKGLALSRWEGLKRRRDRVPKIALGRAGWFVVFSPGQTVGGNAMSSVWDTSSHSRSRRHVRTLAAASLTLLLQQS